MGGGYFHCSLSSLIVKTMFIKASQLQMTSLKYLLSNVIQETNEDRIEICQRSLSKQIVS